MYQLHRLYKYCPNTKKLERYHQEPVECIKRKDIRMMDSKEIENLMESQVK